MLTGRVCLLLALAACAAAAPAAAVRPGLVDRQFASVPNSFGAGMAVGPDGRTVLIGWTYGDPLSQVWVRAYLPDGRPDLSFDSDGVKELAEPQRGPVDVLIQPDGRIVVAFTGWNGVLRLNLDGTPDATFGDGGLRDLGVGNDLSDIALQPDGKLVVAQVGSGNVYLLRLLPDGSRDPGFASTPLSPVPDHAGARLALQQPEGHLVVTASGSDQALIGRVSPDGRLDDGFGAGGFAAVQLGRADWADNARLSPATALTRDGRIRVPASFRTSANAPLRMALVGLTPDGHPDLGFGNRGLAVAPRRAIRGGNWPGMAIPDPSGALVVAAGDVMRRFHADGTYDRSFVSLEMPGGSIRDGAFLDADTLLVSTSVFGGKYQIRGATTLSTLHAGHDRRAPSLSAVARGCRAIRVRARDGVGLDTVTVRADGRVLRRTPHTRYGPPVRFNLRVRQGLRQLSVVATDFAGNTSRERIRLPRC
jgi:uncharacterized delta-60 repeat protein